jgi:serine/threonine-protein kinase PknG
VGGRSLKELALSRLGPDGRRAPLPLPQVLAYAVEVLPALGYLHDRGLLFCDFKPDNVIHAEEQLKLIDLGAVRRIGDDVSALYGTPGYQAPELADVGPSIGSDLYTVGRSLAVLSFDFTGFTSKYAERLPDPADIPLLAAEESYYRLLQRATNRDPLRRFGSAGEMADQALGVLREVLAAADGVPRPAPSTQFTPERRAFGTRTEANGTPGGPLDPRAVATVLPLPLVDPTDPGAAFLATLSSADPAGVVAALQGAPVRSLEVSLQLVRARVDAGDPAGAAEELRAVAGIAAGDWRLDWYAGLVALAAGQPAEARDAFDRVYDAVPGEPAVQLALAVATELAGDPVGAARRYTRVWLVDHGYVSAAFGLARQLLGSGDRAGAVTVLDQVPDSSSEHVAAQIAAVRARLDPGPGPLTEVDLVDASARIERLRLDSQRHATLAVEMFRTALAWLGATMPAQAPSRAPVATRQLAGRVLGQQLSERDVRFGLEKAYRLLATLEPDTMARYALVDQANAVRPRTVV